MFCYCCVVHILCFENLFFVCEGAGGGIIQRKVKKKNKLNKHGPPHAWRSTNIQNVDRSISLSSCLFAKVPRSALNLEVVLERVLVK